MDDQTINYYTLYCLGQLLSSKLAYARGYLSLRLSHHQRMLRGTYPDLYITASPPIASITLLSDSLFAMFFPHDSIAGSSALPRPCEVHHPRSCPRTAQHIPLLQITPGNPCFKPGASINPAVMGRVQLSRVKATGCLRLSMALLRVSFSHKQAISFRLESP